MGDRRPAAVRHSRTVTITTALHPEKGWSWEVTYNGDPVARGKHHVPLELVALRSALASARQHVAGRIVADASPDEVIRADKWRDEAMRLSAIAGAHETRGTPARVPVRLDCGHIRLVKPATRLGKDQVNCGPCKTHRVVEEFLDYKAGQSQ